MMGLSAAKPSLSKFDHPKMIEREMQQPQPLPSPSPPQQQPLPTQNNQISSMSVLEEKLLARMDRMEQRLLHQLDTHLRLLVAFEQRSSNSRKVALMESYD